MAKNIKALTSAIIAVMADYDTDILPISQYDIKIKSFGRIDCIALQEGELHYYGGFSNTESFDFDNDDWEESLPSEEEEIAILSETLEYEGDNDEDEDNFEGTGMSARDIRNLTTEEMERLGIYDDDDEGE